MTPPPKDDKLGRLLRVLARRDQLDPEEFDLLSAVANLVSRTGRKEERWKHSVNLAMANWQLSWRINWTSDKNGITSGALLSPGFPAGSLLFVPLVDSKFLLELTGIPADLQLIAIGRVSAPTSPGPVSVPFTAPPSWAAKEIRPAAPRSDESNSPSVYQLAASGGSEPVTMIQYRPTQVGAIIATFHDDPRTGKALELDIVTDKEWQGLYLAEVSGIGEESTTERILISAINETKHVPQLVADVIDELDLKNACHGFTVLSVEDGPSRSLTITLRPLSFGEIADHLFESVVGLHGVDMVQDEITVERNANRCVVSGPAFNSLFLPHADSSAVYYLRFARTTPT